MMAATLTQQGVDLRIRQNSTITIIYAARDEEHNEARVLKQFLEAKL